METKHLDDSADQQCNELRENFFNIVSRNSPNTKHSVYSVLLQYHKTTIPWNTFGAKKWFPFHENVVLVIIKLLNEKTNLVKELGGVEIPLSCLNAPNRSLIYSIQREIKCKNLDINYSERLLFASRKKNISPHGSVFSSTELPTPLKFPEPHIMTLN